MNMEEVTAAIKEANVVCRLPQTTYGIMKTYNEFIAKSKQEYLVWYLNLSDEFRTMDDLLESCKKELAEDEIILMREKFDKINAEVGLDKFDFASAFYIVCSKTRNN